MKIQGGDEGEIGPVVSVTNTGPINVSEPMPVVVNNSGIVTLQVAHRIIREYFMQDIKLDTFEILHGYKDKGFWQFKCLVNYPHLVKLVEMVIGTEIERISEIYREKR